MKPATTCILGLLSILIHVGCAGGAATGENAPDAPPPPKVKQPPPPKDGTRTAPGCDGIPESGQCRDGVATYCDVDKGELRRKDCKALGQSCLVDTARGAVCGAVMPGGDGPTTCDTGVTFEGSCTGQTAVWCDPESNQTISWDCAGDGLACTVDACAVGAFCCGSSPSPVNECPALGFAGACEGNTARWCSGDQLIENACSNGQTCQLDACADGAFCCDPPDAPPPQNECDQLGVRGICTAEGTVRWCNGGEVDEVTCLAGHTCQIDLCGDGASCCAP